MTYPSGLCSETIGSLLTLTALLPVDVLAISSAAVELEGECIDSLAESEKYEVWESRRLKFVLIIYYYLELCCDYSYVCIYVYCRIANVIKKKVFVPKLLMVYVIV